MNGIALALNIASTIIEIDTDSTSASFTAIRHISVIRTDLGAGHHPGSHSAHPAGPDAGRRVSGGRAHVRGSRRVGGGQRNASRQR